MSKISWVPKALQVTTRSNLRPEITPKVEDERILTGSISHNNRKKYNYTQF